MGIAKVHDFVKKFVYNNKVISYGLFLEFFEVFGEDLNDSVEEEEDLGGVRIPFCESEEVEIVVANVEVLYKSDELVLVCDCLSFPVLV